MRAQSALVAVDKLAMTSRPTRRYLHVVTLFALVVLAHWVEHVVQVIQIHVLGVPPQRALGAVGWAFPGLVESEWLHFAFNLVLLVGLVVLLDTFRGRPRTWWQLAIAAQCWHFFEHWLLFAQAQTGARFFGTDAPTSVLQLIVPRADLHLVYNGVVTVVVLIALFTRGRVQGNVHRLPGFVARPRAVPRAAV